MQGYSDPSRASDPYALPDIEAFNATRGEWWTDENGERHEPPSNTAEALKAFDEGWEPCAAGWYVWSCFPGCLPESDPDGPYKSAEEAIESAQSESID